MDYPNIDKISEDSDLQEQMNKLSNEIVKKLEYANVDILVEISCIFGGTLANMVEEKMTKLNRWQGSH